MKKTTSQKDLINTRRKQWRSKPWKDEKSHHEVAFASPESTDNYFKHDDWLKSSRALLDDGIIYYKAPKGRYRKQFKKLERKLGIDFERVKNSRDAEIHCTYEELPYYAGVCQRFSTGKFYIRTDPEYKNTHVEAHEIGHALGLAHNESDRSVLSHDAWYLDNNYLTRFDRNNILEVFEGLL